MGEYYLGLDIGTDSVGYAVTDTAYALRKFKGEPMWGTHLFESGQEAADRRTHRTNRRRIDRRQQRVDLVNELFSDAITRIDPHFFARRKESALFREDSTHGVRLFTGEGITDREYHKQYPTIHHLILELMMSREPHDVRLVYLACAWLVAHRGHFLFDFGADQVGRLLDFQEVYGEFCSFLDEQGCVLPWQEAVSADVVLSILQMDAGVGRKKEAFKNRVFGGKKPAKESADDFPYSPEGVIGLLSGGVVKPKDLFANESYDAMESVSLQMGDEDFDRIVSELGDDGELLRQLRSLHSCARLIAVMANRREGDPVCVSSSKVAIYELHQKDLKVLKHLVKKYCPKQYNEIFRRAVAGNYVAYSGNVKSCKEPGKVKRVEKLGFSDFLKKKLKGLKVSSGDQAAYRSVFMERFRVTGKHIKDHLLQHGHMTREDQVSGIDITIKSGLRSYHIFGRMLNSGLLTGAEVEEIILHAAYTEDKNRMRRWLKAEFPQLSDGDVSYILRQKLKEFGRLSAKLLTGVYGTERGSDGEAFTIIEAMWNTNCNLMQLLSDRYTYTEQIQAYCREYYSEHPRKLTERLSEMYVSNAAKRPIFRTMDIVSDVVKATGCAPKKIFVEMARGGTQEQKGKRTESRKKQLLDYYKKVKDEDVSQFVKALESMDAEADNRLQDRKLYLYYLQLGKCAYTGHPIDLSRLADGSYNLEHIYPQSMVKDDSILNNLVLVESTANGQKSDTYPVDSEIRRSMGAFWAMLKHNGLMTEEKYRRLTRPTPFTPDEKMGFINRQLVETRQSTKVVATLLKERFPETEIVYVKAGLVSEFRQEFGMLKCRSVNDLHHAKDAYLNIVVGNVYHERFTSKWFRIDEHYNVQAKKLFARTHRNGDAVYWNGEADVARVKKTVAKNAVHLTRYAFFRKGGLFDQQPVKAAEGLVPLKKGLPTEQYGGYNKATASCFMLVRFTLKGKREVMLVPVELLVKDRVLEDREFAQAYLAKAVEKIIGKQPEKLEQLLNGRFLKINTVFCFDRVKMALASKDNGGKNVMLSPLVALTLAPEWEQYIKHLESFQNKQKSNKNLQPSEMHDGITKEQNLALYSLLTGKMGEWPFMQFPGNQQENLKKGAEIFETKEIVEQITCLMNILELMGPGSAGVDLRGCGGTGQAGKKSVSTKISNWNNRYSEVRIIDESASGLFSHSSGNLLDLL